MYLAEVTNDDTVLQIEQEMVEKRQAPNGPPDDNGDSSPNEVI